MSADAEYEFPHFYEAARQFGDFLESQTLSSELLWIFREDVCWRKRQLFIKIPLPEENKQRAESLYNLGVTRGLGVRMEALCLLDSHPCCYIWLPSDEIDASYAMLSGLKMSVPTKPLKSHPVKSELLWRIYKWQESKEKFKGIVEEIPLRSS